MTNPRSGDDGSTTNPAVPDWLRDLIAVAFVVLFVAFVVVLVFNINSADTTWGRYLVIFNVVQAFAAAGGGILLGTTIKTQQVKNAQDNEKAANERANEKQQRGLTLRNAIQSSLQRSKDSPSRLFRPSRPVRQQANHAYVEEAQAEQATHWVVARSEATDVDPELEGLAKLAADLFG